jgi:hypothetical protein
VAAFWIEINARWEHKAVLEWMQERLNRTPEASKIRRRTVEHTFGTLKAWMGATHFTMKTLPHVRTEMSLYVLAYNMKRMMQIMGVRNLTGAMKAAWRQDICARLKKPHSICTGNGIGIPKARPEILFPHSLGRRRKQAERLTRRTLFRAL